MRADTEQSPGILPLLLVALLAGQVGIQLSEPEIKQQCKTLIWPIARDDDGRWLGFERREVCDE